MPILLQVLCNLFAFRHNNGRWRWIFGALCAIDLILFASHSLYAFGIFLGQYFHNSITVIRTIPMLVALGFAFVGASNRKAKDWPHWVGVIALFATIVSNTFWLLVTTLGLLR
jgi:hypothetical protein